MTEELFRQDAYLRECEATVSAGADGKLRLDRTVFYPTGGGQPGDRGRLLFEDGTELGIVNTVKDPEVGDIVHICDSPELPNLVGAKALVQIDWERRLRLMRMHTLLHLLCSVVDAGVTGGSIRDDGTGRLDFDVPQSVLDKEVLTEQLNQLVDGDYPVSAQWITEAELDANPGLVRTMSVQPPRGEGRIRLVNIEGVDLQPCGGTHVARTSQIGAVRVRKIEKKGKHNRRVNVMFAQ